MGGRKYRKNPIKKSRKGFLILTNGRASEVTYFQLLSKKSLYHVKVEFYDGDLLNLVRHALKIKDSYSRIWCVFDTDSTPKEETIKEAMILASDNDIHLAYSNPSFEAFLICHFQQPKASLTQKEAISLLNSLISKTNPHMVYKKGDIEMTSKIFIPRYKRAMEISRTTYEKYLKEYQDNLLPIWKFDSSTNLFMLIDDLRVDSMK